MTANLERVSELFHEFCELDEDAQARRLAEIARAEPEVHAKLQELLAGDRSADARLEGAAVDLLSAGGEQSFFRRTRRHLPAPAPGLEPGKAIGDYRLIALLGQGGMGQVWEAEQVSLKRRVAVKFLRPGEVTEKQLELFAREARAGGRLNHPGIVSVYGYGQSDGQAWIAMELVSGAWTLRDFLDDATRAAAVPEGYDRHVAHLIGEIADAMQAAHEAGVIHRDLKPQNVLIASDARPKVTDFGLARITDESAISHTGEFAGTYFYMSPEQVAARRAGIDHRTDVFSLGIVLYELLALRRPFEGDTSHQVAAQILAKDPPDPRTIRSRIPRDLAVIAGKALEKDRDRRFQTMKELAADLRRYLAHEPIHATPPTTVDRLAKWVKRNPGKSSAAGIVTVAVAVISLLLVSNVQANLDLTRSNADLEAERKNLAAANSSLEKERANLAETNAALEAKTAESEERRREAEAKTNQVKNLSSFQDLDDLASEADRLWPITPGMIPRYSDWLSRAERVLAQLPGLRTTLAQLEERGQGSTQDGAPTWTFASDQDRWWHDQLRKQIDGLVAFSDEESGLFSSGISPEHGWGIRRRLAFAPELEQRSILSAEASGRWKEAIASIGDEGEIPWYKGLRISPQLGLLPIGQDPESGLWEFAHLQTGDPAERGADGRLILKEETGLVLVLLPGGTLRMGAQRVDSKGDNFDRHAEGDEVPVHQVTLSPFFLSKYEMTQGQWSRATGRNPSYYEPSKYAQSWNLGNRPGSLLHPVEQVSWFTSRDVCTWLALTLPSEAQWEYSARGDTSTTWWSGDDSVPDLGNLADDFARIHGGQKDVKYEAWSDGETVHAPIGRYAPNPFGLHDVCGNVWEWCLDGYAAYDGGVPVKDPVREPPDSSRRVYRGGSYLMAALNARSAIRGSSGPEYAGYDVGLRPARMLQR